MAEVAAALQPEATAGAGEWELKLEEEHFRADDAVGWNPEAPAVQAEG